MEKGLYGGLSISASQNQYILSRFLDIATLSSADSSLLYNSVTISEYVVNLRRRVMWYSFRFPFSVISFDTFTPSLDAQKGLMKSFLCSCKLPTRS